MIISTLLVVASIFIGIFTAIYIKKKNRLYNLKTKEDKNLKKQKKSIEKIWGINQISNSILTINNKNSIIIELGSIEYRLLNEEEQNNVDNVLINLSKTFSYQTQFFSTIEKIDTTNKIKTIRDNLDKQKNIKIKEYGESIISYLENIMKEENLYVRKNYLIVTSNEPYIRAQVNLIEFYNQLKYNLSNIRVISRLLSDMDIIELIYRELNKNEDEKIRNIITEGGLDFCVTGKKRKKNTNQ